MATYSKRGKRRWAKAYLMGAGTVLAAELVVVGVLALPPTVAIAGSAEPGAAAQQVRQEPPPTTEAKPEPEPAPPPPSPPPPSTSEAPPPVRDQPVSSGQRPGTIQLPDGGTANLVREEVGADAVLPVPDDLGDATWWGAGLGAPSGASVFAGHVNWHGQTGPFSELWDVGVDEKVTVTDADGKVWTYRVAQIVTLHKDELPARATELFSQSGKHRIVLVTCGGRWLGGNTGYAENRVVIAEPA
ncbi:class F sortase [Prauserella cavernicola]|uniref:Class F sortase n=1 Tax=Prauserella cavernicola TaxID=2800127 RepID=A0A934QSV3_9PSEU|nr:class F sortase [Prauserella cavernicola]MBK1785611.1 class F sortase [Prauserella cavernicola]